MVISLLNKHNIMCNVIRNILNIIFAMYRNLTFILLSFNDRNSLNNFQRCVKLDIKIAHWSSIKFWIYVITSQTDKISQISRIYTHTVGSQVPLSTINVVWDDKNMWTMKKYNLRVHDLPSLWRMWKINTRYLFHSVYA